MAARRKPLVLVSGFGPFERVEQNPSGEIARALAADPPPGLRVVAKVLPASFARGPLGWDALLARAEAPALCLALGVAKRPGFRLERYAEPRLKQVPRVDVDGRTARAFSRPGRRLETSVALRPLLEGLRARGVERVRISRTAGGYVCERVYHHLLVRAGERGVPGLFVHVPPLCYTPLARQIRVLRWMLELWAADAAFAASTPRSALNHTLNHTLNHKGRGAGNPRVRLVVTRRTRARPR
jgi:pyroglutamyl-peptidase